MKTAFTTWRSYPDVTEAFMALSSSSPSINDRCMALLECYVVLLYDSTSSSINVNEARKQLFHRKIDHSKQFHHQGKPFSSMPKGLPIKADTVGGRHSSLAL